VSAIAILYGSSWTSGFASSHISVENVSTRDESVVVISNPGHLEVHQEIHHHHYSSLPRISEATERDEIGETYTAEHKFSSILRESQPFPSLFHSLDPFNALYRVLTPPTQDWSVEEALPRNSRYFLSLLLFSPCSQDSIIPDSFSSAWNKRQGDYTILTDSAEWLDQPLELGLRDYILSKRKASFLFLCFSLIPEATQLYLQDLERLKAYLQELYDVLGTNPNPTHRLLFEKIKISVADKRLENRLLSFLPPDTIFISP
jgi:hypothetical protein